MKDDDAADRSPGRDGVRRASVLKALAGLLVVAGIVAASVTGVLPSVDAVQREVRGYGAWAPVAYVVAYAVLVCFPTPASLLTIMGGALFGLGLGLLYAWLGAMLGALLAFEVGRVLGRDAIARLTRGRLEPVEKVLGEHGFLAVVAIRLTPVFPYLAVNYGAGLSSLSRRDYALGTALGIVPGAIAYVSVGAYGTDPVRLFVAIAALVVLTLGGAYVGRRMLRREGIDLQRSENSADGQPRTP